MSSAHDIGASVVHSLGDLGAARLSALGDALDLDERQSQSALSLFRLVSEPWGRLPIRDVPAWENDLTDDSTPFEFSVGFEAEKPELRILFESQLDAGELTQLSSWHAGIALQARLRARGLCDTTQFEKVAPLFAPSPHYLPRFALWHAAVLRDHGPSLIKTYVNPEIAGVERARPLAAAAFGRLELGSSWAFVERHLGPSTRLPYISLDLEPASSARVKVYITASHADEVEQMLLGCSNHQPGEARGWLRQLLENDGPYESRPILVCYSFRAGEAIPDATVHVPIRSYVPNDEVAMYRALDLLPAVNGRQLARAMSCLAMPTLSRSQGVLTYVSLRVVGGRVRVTTYLAPRAYTIPTRGSTGTIPTGRPSAPTATDV